MFAFIIYISTISNTLIKKLKKEHIREKIIRRLPDYGKISPYPRIEVCHE